MVASKRVMHKPKKAKNDELERVAAAARKISIAWKHAMLRKPLLQVRRSHAVGIVWRCASMGRWGFASLTVRAVRSASLSPRNAVPKKNINRGKGR